MAVKTPAPAPAATKPQPPDERFWVKYSPHHELPISGMASLAWHTLVAVLIVAVGFIVAGSRTEDMPIETIEYGGGGGDPNGVGLASGLASPRVEAADDQPKEADRPAEAAADVTGLQVQPKDPLQDLTDDVDAQRELEKFIDRGNDGLKKLARLDKQFREGLLGIPGHGEGGPGSRGGRGDGVGGGIGSGEGSGRINTRTKRQLRWTITFSTTSGHDYVRQLHVLGAILAFKHPADSEIKVVKDLLSRPLKLETEDLKKLNRIFWIDDTPQSVKQLAEALGLDFTPNQIVALFPRDFEVELANKERAFANRSEDQIKSTRFLILVTGNRYEVRVTDQK